METLSLYRHEPTDRPDVFRVMDLDGDWRWYFHKPTGRYVPAVNAVLQAGYPKDERFHQYLLSVTKDEAKKILETAGERGSRVHNAIQVLEDGQTLTYAQLFPNSLTGRPEPLTTSEWKCLLAWSTFVVEWSARIIPCKRTVLGTDYAGTLDDVLEVTVPASAKRSHSALVGQTITVLFDYKTSSGIHDEYQSQTAAYFFGDSLPVAYTGILRLGTAHKNGPVDGAGYEVALWDRLETNEHYGDFRCAYRFWRKNTKQFKADDMAASIPTILSVSIPTNNNAPIAKDPAAHLSNGVSATEAQADVGQQLSDAEERAQGVPAGEGRVLSGRAGGRKAGGDGVHGEEGDKATVPVRNSHGGRVRRTKAVPQS